MYGRDGRAYVGSGMACDARHHLMKGRRRKDGKRRWKCRDCKRSASVPAKMDDIQAWLMATLLINTERSRQERVARDVMES